MWKSDFGAVYSTIASAFENGKERGEVGAADKFVDAGLDGLIY